MSGHKQKESQSEPGATAMTGVSLNSKKESVIEKKSKLLTDLISELIQEPDSIDLQGNEDVEAFQTSSLSDEEGKMLVSEDDLLEALIVLRQGARR